MTQSHAVAIPPLRSWTTDILLPFWASKGFDEKRGCFVEQLALDGTPNDPGFTRFRVQARQTYVFAHAHILGAGDYALPRALDGFAFLKRCWSEKDGGFPMRLTLDAEIVDPTIDLYDHAFAILALAWMHRATGEQEPLDWAERVLSLITERMAHPAGGFVEQLPVDSSKPRRQNPHMHLLEAFLAAHAATRDARWLAQAENMVGLLIDHFLDDQGTLAEFFDDEWRLKQGHEGQIREPGHQFEWVWLLNRYRAQGGARDVDEIADRLMTFGVRHGIDTSEGQVLAAFNEIAPDGQIIDGSKRFWPQTEAIRAFAVMHEQAEDEGAAEMVRTLLAMLFQHYLSAEDGILRDGLSRDGTACDPFSPSSSLYHLWGAILEARDLIDG
ncbi:MAG: AGE family epimerase/isomerase [Pseudomonadota bacterium]